MSNFVIIDLECHRSILVDLNEDDMNRLRGRRKYEEAKRKLVISPPPPPPPLSKENDGLEDDLEKNKKSKQQ